MELLSSDWIQTKLFTLSGCVWLYARASVLPQEPPKTCISTKKKIGRKSF